jgi:hypothetical protein
MNLSSLRKNLENFDYRGNSLKTYLVFVPVLSLIIQKIQLANILPLPSILNFDERTQQEWVQINSRSRKFALICKWHFGVSVIQAIAAAVLAITKVAPLVSILLGLTAAYAMGSILVKAFKNTTAICEFHSDGSFKAVKLGSIFSEV